MISEADAVQLVFRLQSRFNRLCAVTAQARRVHADHEIHLFCRERGIPQLLHVDAYNLASQLAVPVSDGDPIDDVLSSAWEARAVADLMTAFNRTEASRDRARHPLLP